MTSGPVDRQHYPRTFDQLLTFWRRTGLIHVHRRAKGGRGGEAWMVIMRPSPMCADRDRCRMVRVGR